MNKFFKFIYIFIGFLALGLGILGIILPLLPTTPLLLLASFCFVKGSERFEHWFKGTTIYKRHLENFVRERAMTLQQKLTILLFADVMIAIAFFFLDRTILRIMLLLIVANKYYYFIFKIKTIQVGKASQNNSK
ncbi:YbaN family protein [Neobacillus sp. OS1-2]|uniref:YbaN family protein n=1 Tax=Neobacillus sp. OS1-2 TaxID=3070680 RepID=UPI0027DF1A6C|nr:YbaN family protein [Neobacillus sp. OS1-2]WML42306.1 YbaN family protein [Neobacillus sp. OS1-2]